MLRTDEDPELLVFDPVIRFLHWLTLFPVVTIFVLAARGTGAPSAASCPT
jgi:hypothetical protein